MSFFIVNNAVQCITLYCFTLMYFVHLCLIGLWFDFLLTVFHWPWPSAVMMVYIGLAGNLCSATACVFFFFLLFAWSAIGLDDNIVKHPKSKAGGLWPQSLDRWILLYRWVIDTLAR